MNIVFNVTICSDESTFLNVIFHHFERHKLSSVHLHCTEVAAQI